MFDFIGFIAAFLTTISFLPQVIKIIISKDTESISLFMYLAFVTGVACWLIYGIYLNSMQIILANAVTLFLSGIILMLKIKDLFFKRTKLNKSVSDKSFL